MSLYKQLGSYGKGLRADFGAAGTFYSFQKMHDLAAFRHLRRTDEL